MGKPGAFLNIDRKQAKPRDPSETICDFEEFTNTLTVDEQCEQASRCMNCGVAFCQGGEVLKSIGASSGCPLGNLIPETNDLLYRRRFDDAMARLLLTNPFPEFTGRVCPAPCEDACNLGLHKSAVTIHDNERLLSDYAWEQGMDPLPEADDDAPCITVVGTGPAGLACAWELARYGMRVRMIERADKPGGLLMYGIPNMKLPKSVIMQRIKLMEESGIEITCDTDACQEAEKILSDSQAVILAGGYSIPRTVDVLGSDLSGICMALDYLVDCTQSLLDGNPPKIDAAGKDVVVIGGGDTGVDCVATALRQGARSVTQIIRAPRPDDLIEADDMWPNKRNIYSQGYGQREAEERFGEDPRIWSTDTIAFIGDDRDRIKAVRIQDISYDGDRHNVEGTEREIPAQLVLIAKGFTGAEKALFDAFHVAAPEKGAKSHLLTGKHSTPVFVAGDAHLGATLVASAIADALTCTEEVLDHLR